MSVSVLAYQHEAFIAEALDGILAQEVTFPVEIVVGDDASADATPDILRDYAARYPHVLRLHLHATRGAGVPGRVNNVHNLTSCRGRYIALHDGDDVWVRRDKLARQVAFLETHPDYALASQHTHRTDGPDEDISLETIAATGRYDLFASSLLVRREALLPLPPWFDEVVYADYFLACHVLSAGRGLVSGTPYIYYRRHAGSFMSATYRDDFQVIHRHDDLRRLLSYFPRLSGGRGLRTMLAELLWLAILRAARRRRPGLLAAALKRMPSYTPGEHLRAARQTARMATGYLRGPG